jgi:hypothetical protein
LGKLNFELEIINNKFTEIPSTVLKIERIELFNLELSDLGNNYYFDFRIA